VNCELEVSTTEVKEVHLSMPLVKIVIFQMRRIWWLLSCAPFEAGKSTFIVPNFRGGYELDSRLNYSVCPLERQNVSTRCNIDVG
jgi:hypothetical protein